MDEEQPRGLTAEEQAAADQEAEQMAAMIANPLQQLGLGPWFQPAKSSWKWARLATGPDPGDSIHVLRIYNVGGVTAATLTPEQLEQFVEDAQAQLSGRKASRVATPPKKSIHVPGRRG